MIAVVVVVGARRFPSGGLEGGLYCTVVFVVGSTGPLLRGGLFYLLMPPRFLYSAPKNNFLLPRLNTMEPEKAKK